MSDDLFFLGWYAVKTSDLIAMFALIVSGVSAWATIASARAAKVSALAAEKAAQLQQDQQTARTLIRVRTPVVRDDDEGAGRQRRVKITLEPPENGDFLDINTCELIRQAEQLQLMYRGGREIGGGGIELRPPITLSREPEQVNVIMHLLEFRGDTLLEFSGVRH